MAVRILSHAGSNPANNIDINRWLKNKTQTNERRWRADTQTFPSAQDTNSPRESTSILAKPKHRGRAHECKHVFVQLHNRSQNDPFLCGGFPLVHSTLYRLFFRPLYWAWHLHKMAASNQMADFQFNYGQRGFDFFECLFIIVPHPRTPTPHFV